MQNAISRNQRCRECLARVKSRSRRNLCRHCYKVVAIRRQYQQKKCVGLGASGNDVCGNRPLPPLPTAALPGTEEKIGVLCERARLKQQLFHPLDARTDRLGDAVRADEMATALEAIAG